MTQAHALAYSEGQDQLLALDSRYELLTCPLSRWSEAICFFPH